MDTRRGPSEHLIRVNAQRVGPDGALWLVDVGARGFGNSTLENGPKLVRIDLHANAVSRCYPLGDDVLTSDSFIDDVRFNRRMAYITDAGDPGLVVLDLETGLARRVLHHHWSTTAERAISADGVPLRDSDGEPVFIHNDQLEVSPNGEWLYFQPCCGPLARIPTQLLDDFDAPATDLDAAVERFADTGSTGGTAIAADGTIYISDTDTRCISTISSDGSIAVLIEDQRLSWVDAMWLDEQGKLWLPAAQLHLMAPFQHGESSVTDPINVFTLQTDATPPANDHA